MNEHDIFNALSGIDGKYIDEAAYELHGTGAVVGSDKAGDRVVDITSKRRIRKFIYVALPSVAAIILIVAVAMPAILKVSKSDSASMASDTTPAAEDMADAEAAPAAEAAEEAAAPAAEAAANASYDAVAEEPSAEAEATEETAMAEEAEDAEDHAKRDDKALEFNNDNVAVTAGEEAAASWAVSDTIYRKGVLLLFTQGSVPDDLSDKEYTIKEAAKADKDEYISKGLLADLSEHMEIADDYISIDLNELNLKTGKYMIDIGGVSAVFEVR